MWMLLLLFVFAAGILSAGAVLSACALAGRIDCDQAALAARSPDGCSEPAAALDTALPRTNRAPALSI